MGLTTSGEARFWTAGPGSRFEHYEHLPQERLPTHFIVYPEWFGVPPLLGQELAYRFVRHTILGGTTMAAYEARYDLLGTGELPMSTPRGNPALLDSLDVADLEDEAAHGYRLFDATAQTDVVVAGGDRADGGRSFRHRDEFTLRLAPRGVLIARLGTTNPLLVQLRIDGRDVTKAVLAGSTWQEISIPLPPDLDPNRHTVDVDVDVDVDEHEDHTFASLHYWSYVPSADTNP